MIKFTYYDDDDNELEGELPCKFEVCNRCRGEGKHVNPSIDGNGLTYEDFAEDPDFYDDYMGGVYDIDCEVCHGMRVVPVVDEEKANPELLQKYWDKIDAEIQYRNERAHELRMGY